VVIRSWNPPFILTPLFDCSGRFSFLKTAVLSGCLLPALVIWRGEAVLMAGYFLRLAFWRALPAEWRSAFPPLHVLALTCGAGTAFTEFA
jgi:hypothetical protein